MPCDRLEACGRDTPAIRAVGVPTVLARRDPAGEVRRQESGRPCERTHGGRPWRALVDVQRPGVHLELRERVPQLAQLTDDTFPVIRREAFRGRLTDLWRVQADPDQPCVRIGLPATQEGLEIAFPA